MAKRFLTPLGIVVLATDPASGSNGQVYFNSSENQLKIYYDGQWNSLSTGGQAVESGVELSTSWWLGA